MVDIEAIAKDLDNMQLGLKIAVHNTGRGMVWRVQIFDQFDMVTGHGTSDSLPLAIQSAMAETQVFLSQRLAMVREMIRGTGMQPFETLPAEGQAHADGGGGGFRSGSGNDPAPGERGNDNTLDLGREASSQGAQS